MRILYNILIIILLIFLVFLLIELTKDINLVKIIFNI